MNYVRHPLCAIFPQLDDESLQALADDIHANGLHEPILLVNGEILDGWNRYRACLMCGEVPRFEEYEGDDLVAFVISANLRRRHLTVAQMAQCATACYEWLKRGRPAESVDTLASKLLTPNGQRLPILQNPSTTAGNLLNPKLVDGSDGSVDNFREPGVGTESTVLGVDSSLGDEEVDAKLGEAFADDGSDADIALYDERQGVGPNKLNAKPTASIAKMAKDTNLSERSIKVAMRAERAGIGEQVRAGIIEGRDVERVAAQVEKGLTVDDAIQAVELSKGDRKALRKAAAELKAKEARSHTDADYDDVVRALEVAEAECVALKQALQESEDRYDALVKLNGGDDSGVKKAIADAAYYHTMRDKLQDENAKFVHEVKFLRKRLSKYEGR